MEPGNEAVLTTHIAMPCIHVVVAYSTSDLVGFTVEIISGNGTTGYY